MDCCEQILLHWYLSLVNNCNPTQKNSFWNALLMNVTRNPKNMTSVLPTMSRKCYFICFYSSSNWKMVIFISWMGFVCFQVSDIGIVESECIRRRKKISWIIGGLSNFFVEIVRKAPLILCKMRQALKTQKSVRVSRS